MVVIPGLNVRGAAVLTQVLIARYFGRRSFGAISSVPIRFIKGARAGRVDRRYRLRCYRRLSNNLYDFLCLLFCLGAVDLFVKTARAKSPMTQWRCSRGSIIFHHSRAVEARCAVRHRLP
jgi:hypothetical protein